MDMEEPKQDEFVENLRKEYREDLQFSRYKLDDAVEPQADLFDKWHQKWVDWIASQETQKRAIGERHVELEMRLRKALAEEDVETTTVEFKCYKATEAAILSAVDNHKDLKELQLELVRTNKIVNTLRGALEAFQQRKSMIQEMCRLFLVGYFGDVEAVRNREIDEKLARATTVPARRRRRQAN